KKAKKAQKASAKFKSHPKHPFILETEARIEEKQGLKKESIEKKMHWFVSVTSMFILVLTNFIGALLLIPFLLFFKDTAQYAIILVFAIGFGFLFNMIIHSFAHLGDKHHLIAGVVVPAFALLDIVILFTILQKAVDKFKIAANYNYTLIVVLFIVAFLVPYLFDILRGKHQFH
ncbi:hypothetical protein HZA99_06300, partial [Candidatus Woesearchaeota archaeon]|nr:hypothetical protein [Candidatus Woesearchaeota archaeon]